jgi:hypothetical protein
MSSSLQFDASDLVKGSTCPNSAPAAASTRSKEGEEDTRPVVIDLAQIRLVVNIGIVSYRDGRALLVQPPSYHATDPHPHFPFLLPSYVCLQVLFYAVAIRDGFRCLEIRIIRIRIR